MAYPIAQVVVNLPVDGPFSYIVPEEYRKQIREGQRVWVPFGPRKMVGYVVGLKRTRPRRPLKSIFKLIDSVPLLDKNMLVAAKQFAAYFACSWGEAIDTALPSLLRKGREVDWGGLPEAEQSVSVRPPQPALFLVKDRHSYWDVLRDHLTAALRQEGGVIILAPENTQVMAVVRWLEDKGLGSLAVFDKRKTGRQELEEWTAVRRGEKRLVVGRRSAVFAPVRNLRLIVMLDEDHSAYKQEQSPYYHARVVAGMRAAGEGAGLLFISCAPSAELWAQVRKKKCRLLPNPVAGDLDINVVDMSIYQKRKAPILSYPLRDAVHKTLESGGRILLFMNRKGFSTFTVCSECHFVLKCERCDTPLTYLYAQKMMICSRCHQKSEPPSLCPQCQKAYLRFRGMGIEKLESEIAREFPGAAITHYESETATLPGRFQVCVATQAITRELGTVEADTVALVRADEELSRPDFRSAQKTFSLYSHLRLFARKRIIVQTFLPDNYVFKAVARDDENLFYRQELRLRKELGLPPYKHLIEVLVRSRVKQQSAQTAESVGQMLSDGLRKKYEEVGPVQSAIIPKLRAQHRYHVLVKTTNVVKTVAAIRARLHAVRGKKGVIITVNVDP